MSKLEDLKNNLNEVSIYELASLVKQHFEENYKNEVEYVELEVLESNKNELLFYFSAKELAQWG